jgi:hypothetical protein
MKEKDSPKESEQKANRNLLSEDITPQKDDNGIEGIIEP